MNPVKILALTVILLSTTGFNNKRPKLLPKPSKEVIQIQQQVLRNNPKLSKVFSYNLSKSILAASQKYKIPSKLLAAILMQESRYNLAAVNQKSKDFGIAQINHHNVTHMKLDKVKLMTDMDYSVEAGAMILSHYKRFEKKEPLTWSCRYNTGNRPLKVIKNNCMNYLAAVQPWL